MNKPNSEQKIIDLATIKFPVGSKAWHKEYHVCYIIQSTGGQREIKTIKQGSIDNDWVKAYVHVNELQEMNEFAK